MKKLHFEIDTMHVFVYFQKNLNKSSMATYNKSNECLEVCHNASLSLVDTTRMFDEDARNMA